MNESEARAWSAHLDQTLPEPAPQNRRMSNAELLERLEAALHLLQEVEAGMDGRPELDDIQAKISNDVLPTLGMQIDLLHYSRPDVTPEELDEEEDDEGQGWRMEP